MSPRPPKRICPFLSVGTGYVYCEDVTNCALHITSYSPNRKSCMLAEIADILVNNL